MIQPGQTRDWAHWRTGYVLEEVGELAAKPDHSPAEPQ